MASTMIQDGTAPVPPARRLPVFPVFARAVIDALLIVAQDRLATTVAAEIEAHIA